MDKSPKTQVKDLLQTTADRWLQKNRSLVLRQTPVWAQSLAGILVGLGVVAVSAGIFFRIDEVVTVTGKLEALTGSVDVKTPAGGKVASTFFKDGELVTKGQLLIRFDTRQAASDRETTLKLIELERSDLKAKLQILEDQKKVLKQKVGTNEEITKTLEELVSIGGYQKVQYLQQLDALYELQNMLSGVELELARTKLDAEK